MGGSGRVGIWFMNGVGVSRPLKLRGGPLAEKQGLSTLLPVSRPAPRAELDAGRRGRWSDAVGPRIGECAAAAPVFDRQRPVRPPRRRGLDGAAVLPGHRANDG